MEAGKTREERIQDTARQIFAATREDKPSLLSPERWQGEMMEWAMADERLKVEMLRFVDVFPTLRSRREMSRHLREYFARQGVAAPKVLRWGISLAGDRSPVAPLASGVIKRQMKGFAQRFIVGRDARSAIPALKALRDHGTSFTLDVLGEASVSEAEAHAYQQTYLTLLDGLAATVAAWTPQPVVDDSAWGALPRVNLSLKITSLYSQIDPVDFAGSVTAVKERLRPIFRKAIETGAALTLDLEQFRYRDLTFSVFTSLLDEEEFRGYHDAGVVLQAYLRDAERDPDDPAPFANQPHADFSRRENREAYDSALAAVRGRFGTHYPLRIGGRDIETAKTLASVNPAAPDEVIGTVAYGGRAEAEAAVAAARAALPAWRDAAPRERASVLFRAAELMRAEALELAALMTLEAGKTRREANGDVDEAIDFLEYYGREMLRLGKPRRMGHVPGEHNVYFYESRGVALVIAPWNFPLAILTGMTSAELVAGDPVIVKPAGPTPVIAAQMTRLLEAAGAPPGTVNFLPSPGGEVGDFLVRHPRVDLIAFTGSMDVGLRIISQAAQNPAADGVKKVIAEMGGKNAIIVDADADLDVAVGEVIVRVDDDRVL